jgi:hypothetical protein
MLKELLNDTVTNDCIYKNAFSSALIGRTIFYESHAGMLRIIPDLCMICSKASLTDNIITYDQVVTGTSGKMVGLGSNDKSEVLVNPFKIPEEHMDNNLRTQFLKYEMYMRQNKLFSFQHKVTISLFLNENMTHIEKRIADIFRFEVSDAN